MMILFTLIGIIYVFTVFYVCFINRKIKCIEYEIDYNVKKFEASIDKNIDTLATLSTEFVHLNDRVEKLEANDSSTEEKMQKIADTVAEELNKRWDEGMQQIINYNPFEGLVE